MLDADILSAFNQFRQASPGETYCPAPSMNLHFSQLGVVTACCFNRTQTLGVYPENSLSEIWQGPAVRQLREALQSGEFPSGCAKCFQQIQSRDFAGSHAGFYSYQARILAERQIALGMTGQDGLSADLSATGLPMKLEFNIHNACNLQCIMCHGLASSAIRAHREGLPAMPNPYDMAFVEQLLPFLPYVVEADFMGGEPFLISVYKHIWQAICQLNPKTKVGILTNATILNDEIKALLEGLNCWIHISIDSFVKSTYETIRRGACYEQVMENCAYFKDLMAARGQSMIWRFCPMRINWHEIPDTASYCTENGIKLFFNQVDSPIGLSLITLPKDELANVVATLTAREPRLPQTPVGLENLQNYRELLARLSGLLQDDNRHSNLASRLQSARAVVSQYSRDRELHLKARVKTANDDDHLTQAIRSYLITRVNVEQAQASEEGSQAEFLQCLAEAQQSLSELNKSNFFQQFLQAYLKEILRVISGVWGVIEVHNREVLDYIEEMVDGLTPTDIGELATDWGRVMAVDPRLAYQSIAFATSPQSIRAWLDTL